MLEECVAYACHARTHRFLGVGHVCPAAAEKSLLPQLLKYPETSLWLNLAELVFHKRQCVGDNFVS